MQIRFAPLTLLNRSFLPPKHPQSKTPFLRFFYLWGNSSTHHSARASLLHFDVFYIYLLPIFLFTLFNPTHQWLISLTSKFYSLR